MKNFLGRFIYIAILLILVIGVFAFVFIQNLLSTPTLQDNSHEYQITKYDANIIIDEHNVLNITETLNVHFSVASHGIFRAIPETSTIYYTKENGEINIGYTYDKKYVTLYVKDNGIGIDMKYKGKIFGKFVQLNNVYSKKESSTGLGLTITKELVELHGGKIWFESIVGDGTTFFVRLPLRHRKPREI